MGGKGEGEKAGAGQFGGEGAGEHLPGQQGGEDGVEEQANRVRGHVGAA